MVNDPQFVWNVTEPDEIVVVGFLSLPSGFGAGASTFVQPDGVEPVSAWPDDEVLADPWKSVIFQSSPSLASVVSTPLSAVALSPLTLMFLIWIALMRFLFASVIVE